MYFPYLRGKQNELIMLRENAALISTANFSPIIEPVKESVGGLKRAVDAISDAEGLAVIIINPMHGSFVGNTEPIQNFVQEELEEKPGISMGVLCTETVTVEYILELLERHKEKPVSLIHAGFKESKHLAQQLIHHALSPSHIFFEDSCGKLYRRHFNESTRILLRDGFERRTNRHHPDIEFFSDLHITFDEENADGFGDFLIVGDDYSESGGPAYTIAIHVTFIDPDNDEAMYIHHFKSIRRDTSADPAGKFIEALELLVREVEKPDTKIYRTDAITQFIQLFERRHFPGLGVVKKLSMQHHIETMHQYFQNS